MRTNIVMLFTILCTVIPVKGDPTPPKAKVIPKKLEKHGHTRVDNYYWLKDRENPAVIEYLEAENSYMSAMMEHTKPLQETLFNEFKERIKQSDSSAPYRKDGYLYYTRTEAGRDYPVYCRKKGSEEAPEEVILDVNQVGAGSKFCSVGGVQVSNDSNLLSYAADTVGRRFYTIRFKDLRTGELLADRILDVTSNVAWANDNKTFFYTRQDPATLRSYRVYRHMRS